MYINDGMEMTMRHYWSIFLLQIGPIMWFANLFCENIWGIIKADLVRALHSQSSWENPL